MENKNILTKEIMVENEIIFMPMERVINKILLIRRKKVMLDKDLAGLYKVKAIALRQAVKRNSKRFPEDFMFQLTKKEAILLVSQNVIPSTKYFGGLESVKKEVKQVFDVLKQLLIQESKPKTPMGFRTK